MNEKVSFGKELKRKILHLMAMSAAIVWLYALEDCFRSVLTAFIFGGFSDTGIWIPSDRFWCLCI